ncbi:MAG: polyprenyl synthetase family protein, partial [Microbacterium sp.]
LLDVYESLGGLDQSTAIDAACAMELLHMALVMHDDVIDRDQLRRGELNVSGLFASEALIRGADRRTAAAWGEASSLLAGDLALTLAQSILARLDVGEDRRQAVLDAFDDAVFESAAGEHDDVWLSMHLERATTERVLEMIARKTAAYSFAAPLVVGAILAGATRGLVDELTEIARDLGVIYQLRDDVLGLFGDERDTGKSTLSDLREGKETLLVACARSDPAWPDVARLFGDPGLDPAGAHRIARVIEESGARVFVESAIADRSAHVHDLIRQAGLPDRLRTRLAETTDACSLRAS